MILKAVATYAKSYNAIAQDLFYVKSLGKRARVEYEDSVYKASSYAIKFTDGTGGPASQREFNMSKSNLFDFQVIHNKIKRNKKTVSMEENLASDYTSLSPYNGTVVKSNIKRVSLLCDPTLRAALPPLANDAPQHLKQEVSTHQITPCHTQKHPAITCPPFSTRQISDHHMQWLEDCQTLLTDPSIAFHKKHMVVMDTEESFIPGPCIIGSETTNVYQMRNLITWPEAVSCMQDFVRWNKRAKDDLKVSKQIHTQNTHFIKIR
jgi:hypothetical protein